MTAPDRDVPGDVPEGGRPPGDAGLGERPPTAAPDHTADPPIVDRAPYMHWSKLHERATHDLTGSNLHPLGLDELPGAVEALALHGPNDEGYAPLIEAIAGRYGVAPERVCTATGASGANFLAMAALVRPGDPVLVERPAYDPLLGALRLMGADIRRFERRFEDAWQPDPDEVGERLAPGTRLVVLTNLHNPSGARIPDETLDAIGARAERAGARVLVDEVYLEAAFATAPRPAATRSPTFISTNSLTKTWGLAGLRAGWALAAPKVAEAMRRVRDVVDAVGSFPSDALATVAFGRLDALEARARSILEPNTARLARVLDGADAVEWVRPEGGPVAFPRLRGGDDAGPFVRRALAEHGLGLVPGRFFERPAHFRVAVGGDPARVRPALDRLADALEAWVGPSRDG